MVKWMSADRSLIPIKGEKTTGGVEFCWLFLSVSLSRVLIGS